MTTLGKLERVELRDIWQTEAQHFTPWLAQEGTASHNTETGADEFLKERPQDMASSTAQAPCLFRDIGKELFCNAWPR